MEVDKGGEGETAMSDFTGGSPVTADLKHCDDGLYDDLKDSLGKIL